MNGFGEAFRIYGILRLEIIVAGESSGLYEVVFVKPSTDLVNLLYLQKVGVLYVTERLLLNNTYPIKNSAIMQPTDHMSIFSEYCLAPSSSSGARYHRVTTFEVYV